MHGRGWGSVAALAAQPASRLRVADIALSASQVLHGLVVHRLHSLLSLLDVAAGGDSLGVVLRAVGVLGLLTDEGTPFPESEGDETAGETEETKERRSPLVAQSVVHLVGEQDDTGTPERTDEGLSGKGRGGLMLVGVDEVVVGSVVEEDETEADRKTSETRTNPVQPRVRCPGKDEETDGDEPAAEHHGNKTDLSGRSAVVLVDHLDVVIVDEGSAHGREDDTNSQWNEHETSLAGTPSLALLVDDGVGDEEHVEETVQDGHVQADEQDNDLAEEQLEGADKEDLQPLRQGPEVEISFGDVVLIASLLAHLLRAGSQDSGRIGLLDGESNQAPDKSGQDELDPIEPSPALGIG